MASNRAQLEALYKLFNKFALDDQRAYYEAKVGEYRASASQVNNIRAVIGFITGFASAAAGLVVQTSFDANGSCLSKDSGSVFFGTLNQLLGMSGGCATVQTVSTLLVLVGIVTPAIGVGFNILSDLFQWDRLITVYDSALENIEVADARSPDPDMDDITYRASLHAFTEGTLSVMYDETAQWGQLIRTPLALEQFITQETQVADKASGGATTRAATVNGPLPTIPVPSSSITPASVPTPATPVTPVPAPPAATPVQTTPTPTSSPVSSTPAPAQAGLAADSASNAASQASPAPPPDNSPAVG